MGKLSKVLMLWLQPRTTKLELTRMGSDQSKEIEENNRMGKTIDLFKKIRDTKGTLHVKMGTIRTEIVWI